MHMPYLATPTQALLLAPRVVQLLQRRSVRSLQAVQQRNSAYSVRKHKHVTHLLRCSATKEAELDAGSQPGLEGAQSKVYEVTLRKPLGMVLAEDRVGGATIVEELVPGGNADKSGVVAAGDVVKRCSAYVLKAGKESEFQSKGHGARPYDNWERIMFDCTGQDFKTVMSAISSNNERWGIFNVTLELLRP